MIRIFTRQIERLHSEDGQAMVFVGLVGLIIFLFFAMTMNVAELVNTKIKNQNVADAAAISAAVWQARTLNLISAANRNMLEHWGLAIMFWYSTGFATLACTQMCGQFSVDMLWCVICLVGAAITAGIALSASGGAVTNGYFQDMVLDGMDMNVVDGDMPQVVDLNYEFKENTRSDDVGVYLYYPTEDVDFVRAYTPGNPESGDYVLERVGICTVFVMAARYLNYMWHQTDETGGLSDANWQTALPTIEQWYSDGGPCYQNLEGLDLLDDPAQAILFPLGLRSRISDWSGQNLDSLLAMSVATYKEKEPPSVLGKGSDPGNCTWQDGDTRFACPDKRHYAFASAHAYSASASEFYNSQMAGFASAHLIPYITFEMDWEPRLFPLEPYPNGAESVRGGYQAYQYFANQVPEDTDYLLDHVLMLQNGMRLFLY
jgi:hypothetical protein